MPEIKATLYKKNDQLFARMDGKEDMQVGVVWIRPISGRGSEISLRGEKEEFAMLRSLDELDPQSRAFALEDLERRYYMPEITAVTHTEAAFGNRYWEVETDRGSRKFAMKNPFLNIRWVTPDEAVIRDVHDNIFHLKSLTGMDPQSRAEVDKVT